MTEEENIKLHLKEMLFWFHSFCEENKIRYYALGGTLLGALRHKGFIPWDDDVDIGVPRPDYEKLISSIKNNSERYVLESPNDNADDFFYPYAKLYDTRTTAVEHNKYKTKRGIYLDIFPIDGIGNTAKEVKKNFNSFNWKFNLLVSRTNSVKKGRSRAKNLVIILINIVPQFIINDKKLLRYVCKECRRYDYETSAFCGNLVGAYHRKEIVPKSVFGNPTPYQFEDFIINGPEKASEYLSHIYGDWETIPPVEKRKGHHGFDMVDLSESYCRLQSNPIGNPADR